MRAGFRKVGFGASLSGSFRSPNTRALAGHEATQYGSAPCATRSAQKVHLLITRSTSFMDGAPYGHTQPQYPQAMHTSSFTDTMPVSGSLCMAPVGQLLAHAGLSQCL